MGERIDLRRRPPQHCLIAHDAIPVVAAPKAAIRRTHCGILQTSRGLSPLAFCDLNGSIIFYAGKALQMTAPQNATASSALDPALLRTDGPLATITLNRPAAFNAIDLAIAKRLEELGLQVEASENIRVLVIEGEGRAFCAGGDLATIGAAAAADTIAPVVGEMLQHYHGFIATLRRMPKIVLASVHGSAAGAGLSLAFVADLCIAAEDARFTPAYAKLGVSPDGGGTVGVVRAVGVRRALQIFLAEDSFSAAQAFAWGLVAKVVPAAELRRRRENSHFVWRKTHRRRSPRPRR